MELKNEIAVALDARAFVYKLFQSFFGNEPTEALMDVLKEPDALEALEMFADDNNTYIAALAGVRGIVKNYNIDEVIGEYTRLFIGPNKLPAPPWESVYLADEAVLFDENTLKVRQVYMSKGFLPEEYPHVADDHLSLELDFMHIMSQKAQSEYEVHMAGNAKSALCVCKDFLKEHLLIWVPDFAEKLRGEGIFYPMLSSLLTEFLGTDSKLIDEIINNL